MSITQVFTNDGIYAGTVAVHEHTETEYEITWPGHSYADVVADCHVSYRAVIRFMRLHALLNRN